MSEQPNRSRLSEEQRKTVISGMRRAESLRPVAREPVVPAKWDTSFTTLPGYQAIRTQELAAEMVGLGNPFYRLHEGRSGARATIGGRQCLNFASYDYLGLNGHPAITEAVAKAAADWGTSTSASRLTAGERPAHRELERELAAVYEAEDCLTFVSGHATNVSVIAALVGPKDLIVHDALAHNSIVVGAELSRAQRRLYPHNDLDALAELLEASRAKFERCLIVTEGLFSMDGDGADLARLVEIKERWGAWLMVDEAHTLGVLGAAGRGSFELAGVDPKRVDIWMGTLSKTLVGCGGYIAGSRALVDILRYQAAGMVYSVGMPVPMAVASLTALRLMQAEPQRVARLKANGNHFVERARAAGLDVGLSWGYAVSPVVVGDSLRTVMLSDRLLACGINALPIIPPGVLERSARLRFFLSSEHAFADIDETVSTIRQELDRLIDENVSVTSLATLLK
ncbi:MAG: aminotransferase class I/II-fold pyridoxal phosphate-dependent enzyme [Ancalomicrobiaceae bacterium]|nr:aminotransferase class I/II-fold pyridoxal phosphate-dependent enzyme [Ancalomicrobiaceae bacterium]